MTKSSPRSVAPLHLEPRPSPLLRLLLPLMHAGAILLSLPLPLGWPLHLLLPVALLWHGRFLWRRMAALPSLTRDATGQWWLHRDAGDRLLRLAPDSVVWPGLVILNFRCADDGSRRALPLLPDSLAAEQWRRLRAALRQRAG